MLLISDDKKTFLKTDGSLVIKGAIISRED